MGGHLSRRRVRLQRFDHGSLSTEWLKVASLIATTI
jgi:hypothetical protein